MPPSIGSDESGEADDESGELDAEPSDGEPPGPPSFPVAAGVSLFDPPQATQAIRAGRKTNGSLIRITLLVSANGRSDRAISLPPRNKGETEAPPLTAPVGCSIRAHASGERRPEGRILARGISRRLCSRRRVTTPQAPPAVGRARCAPGGNGGARCMGGVRALHIAHARGAGVRGLVGRAALTLPEGRRGCFVYAALVATMFGAAWYLGSRAAALQAIGRGSDQEACIIMPARALIAGHWPYDRALIWSGNPCSPGVGSDRPRDPFVLLSFYVGFLVAGAAAFLFVPPRVIDPRAKLATLALTLSCATAWQSLATGADVLAIGIALALLTALSAERRLGVGVAILAGLVGSARLTLAFFPFLLAASLPIRSLEEQRRARRFAAVAVGTLALAHGIPLAVNARSYLHDRTGACLLMSEGIAARMGGVRQSSSLAGAFGSPTRSASCAGSLEGRRQRRSLASSTSRRSRSFRSLPRRWRTCSSACAPRQGSTRIPQRGGAETGSSWRSRRTPRRCPRVHSTGSNFRRGPVTLTTRCSRSPARS